MTRGRLSSCVTREENRSGGEVGGPIPSTISAGAYNLYYKINHDSKERYPSGGEGSRGIEGTSVVVGGTLVVIFHSCAFPDFLSPPPPPTLWSCK